MIVILQVRVSSVSGLRVMGCHGDEDPRSTSLCVEAEVLWLQYVQVNEKKTYEFGANCVLFSLNFKIWIHNIARSDVTRAIQTFGAGQMSCVGCIVSTSSGSANICCRGSCEKLLVSHSVSSAKPLSLGLQNAQTMPQKYTKNADITKNMSAYDSIIASVTTFGILVVRGRMVSSLRALKLRQTEQF